MQENENKVVVIAGLSDASVAVIDLTREVCLLVLPLRRPSFLCAWRVCLCVTVRLRSCVRACVRACVR